MKYFVLIIAISFVLSACSPADENKTANGANPANIANPANANGAAATNSAAPTGLQPYNGVQNINPNAFNAANDNLKVTKVEPKKDQMPYGSRTAPDDSTISSGSRGKDFFEVRTFNSHPLLAKVEKLMDGTTTKYKVYLKTGKVLDAPADKMTDFAAMGPENILDAVGLLPKPQTAPSTKPEVKKEQKPQ
jgi:hypothetical protein